MASSDERDSWSLDDVAKYEEFLKNNKDDGWTQVEKKKLEKQRATNRELERKKVLLVPAPPGGQLRNYYPMGQVPMKTETGIVGHLNNGHAVYEQDKECKYPEYLPMEARSKSFGKDIRMLAIHTVQAWNGFFRCRNEDGKRGKSNVKIMCFYCGVIIPNDVLIGMTNNERVGRFHSTNSPDCRFNNVNVKNKD